VAATVDSAYWIGFAFIYGLAIGSFLNVVVFRLPEGVSIVSPGSHCPGCQAPIRWRDNVPVLSFLLLGGRCRGCHERISLRYPGVELLTGLVFALVTWRFGAGWPAVLYALFAAALIAAALIDFDHQIIPDEISLGGLVAGLVFAPVVWVVAVDVPPLEAVADSVQGALLGGGLLWSIAFFHARLSVALGRRFEHWPGEGQEPPKPSSADYWLWFPGMGLGDVKLLAMIGAFLGPWGVLETIVSASLIGLVLGLAYAAVTRKFDAPFGFGPALAAGALLSLLFPLTTWIV